MAFIFGVASQEADLYKVVRDFLTGCGRPGKVVQAGTGNGKLNNLIYPAGSAALYETLTLTCVSTSARGGTFGVVGSASGTLPDAVVGQVFKHALVEFYIDFGTVDFAIGDSFTITAGARPGGKPGFSTFNGGPSIQTETLTLICTVSGVQQVAGSQAFVPAQFSVTGSASGGLPDLTQGTLYSNGYLRALLATDPTSATQYVAGDVITMEMAQNPLRAINQQWATLRKTPDSATTQFAKPIEDTDSELVLVGPGLSGDDTVYCGLTRMWNDSQAYAAWTWFAMGSYAPSMTMQEQPLVQGGQTGVRPVHTMWSLNIPYVLIASGRCFKLLTRSNIYYSQSYQGLMLASTLPKYNGYPYFSGGTGDTRSLLWSQLSSNRSSFWNYAGDGNGGAAWVLNEDKTWSRVWGTLDERSTFPMWQSAHPKSYPHAERGMYDLRNNLDGTVPMHQVQITPNKGFLDGVYAIPGRDGRQPEEIVVNRDGSRAVVVQSHHRSGFNDFCAFTLE